METELRNELLVTTSAMQAIVGLLAKQASIANPNFRAEAEQLLTSHLKNADSATREATVQALRNLLSA